ncbi:MAG: putrescine ABC transporter permease PotH, partial [Aquabacterium sp.]
MKALHRLMTALRSGRTAVIALPFGWLLLFFLLPFLIVLQIALAEMGPVQPEGLWQFKEGVLALKLKFSGFAAIAQDPLYLNAYWRS